MMKYILKKLPLRILMTYISIRRLLGQVIYMKHINTKIYIFNKNTPLKKQNPKIECEIKEIRQFSELEKYKKNISTINFAKFNIFLKEGCTGYFAVNGEDVLGNAWARDLKKHAPNHHLKYVVRDYDKKYKNILNIFFAHTNKNYRRKGIYSYIIYYILNKNQNEDTCTVGDIDVSNIGPQKGVKKIGFKFVYTLTYTRLFWIDLTISKDFK